MDDLIATYVKRLRAALQPLSAQKQEQVIAELESHIAEGLEDERMGSDSEERKMALMREMGNPDELGYEMQQVNGRRRWLDFLLAAVPALILVPIVEIAVNRLAYPSPLPLFSEVALALLPLYLLMLAIAHRRRSDGLLIFWLWLGMDTVLIAWQWTSFGNPSLPFALFWSAVALAGFGWLLRLLWRVRRVPLLLWWGLLPFLFQLLETPPVAKGTAILVHAVAGNPATGAPYDNPYSWQGALILEFGLTLTALAFFFLSRRRPLRWTGLALLPLAPALSTATFWGLSGGGIFLFAALPVTIIAVLVGIFMEQRKRESKSLYA